LSTASLYNKDCFYVATACYFYVVRQFQLLIGLFFGSNENAHENRKTMFTLVDQV
jgi:hypothetical protein